MDDIVVGGYEKIKNELIARGYELHDDMFTKSISHFNQMVINGQAFNQEEKTQINIIYFGQGYIENVDGSTHRDLHYFNIVVNNNDNGSIGVESWEEMLSMIKL